MRFELSSLKNQILLTLLFFILSLYGILHHEIWLDEAHHWLLARDSESIGDVIQNMRYEGHPVLWNLLLFFITRFTTDPLGMQLLHTCIATATIFVFLRYAPFKTHWKVLFIFGYFMFFEYNLLSRNYMLGIGFIFIACSLFKQRHAYFLGYTLALSLAAHVHAIFLIIASCFMLIELTELKKNHLNLRYCIGWSIFGIAVVLSVISIIPPSDTVYFNQIRDIPLIEKFTYGITSIFKGLFVLPDFTEHHFWNSNLIIRKSAIFSGFLLILTYILPLFLFYKNKIIWLFVYAGIVVANLFFFLTQLNSVRYDGMLFLLIFSGLWLDHYVDFKSNFFNSLLSQKMFRSIRNISITLILILHSFSGIMAYSRDILLPFDNSLNTFNYLKEKKLDTQILITPTCEGSALSTYLEKKVHFLCTNTQQSYCVWNAKCLIDHKWNALEPLLRNTLSDKKEGIFISKYPITQAVPLEQSLKDCSYTLLKKFDGSILKNNTYFVYRVKLQTGINDQQ